MKAPEPVGFGGQGFPAFGSREHTPAIVETKGSKAHLTNACPRERSLEGETNSQNLGILGSVKMSAQYQGNESFLFTVSRPIERRFREIEGRN